MVDRLAALSGPAFKVYAALLHLAGHKAPRCVASYREIAQAAGLSRSTAIAAIRDLAGAGLVQVEHRIDDVEGHHPNVYTVALEA